MILDWRGDQITEKIQQAELVATDATTQAASDMAEQLHPWVSRTGRLERFTINEPAHREPEGTAGRFGTTRRQGFYGLFLELGWDHIGGKVEPSRPFLRPAGDHEFPKYPGRLRETYWAMP